METIKNTHTFSMTEVATMLGMNKNNLWAHLKRMDLKKDSANKKYAFTEKQVSSLYFFLKDKVRNIHEPDFTLLNKTGGTIDSTEPISANVNYSIIAKAEPTAIEQMIEQFKQFEEYENSPAMKLYIQQKHLFETLTTDDLKIFFMPLIERFKFSYISHKTGIQSQTLTCIKQGNLRGMKKYELTFVAFLKLMKFANDNHVALDMSLIKDKQ